MKAKVKAEYDSAKTIIMHTPGEELFYGCLQGIAALFENKPFDRYKATNEHNNYVQTLKEKSINVKLVKEVLLEDTIDEKGNKEKGKSLDDLTNLADKFLSISYPIELPIETLKEVKDYKQKTLSELHPYDLVKIIFEKPKVYIKESDEKNTEFIAENYLVNPVMNMHFLRDQQITTDKGIVIRKMNSTQRKAETEITKFVFNKLGVKPIYEVNGEGKLEGGDFIPCGNFAFIGQGLRTNSEAIKQLLKNNVFEYSEIAVVKDSYKSQDEMHLDTYFNIAGSNKAVVLEDRIKNNSDKKTLVDTYLKTDSGYINKNKDLAFKDYLNNKGFKTENNSLITLTKEEQLNYGLNFLTIAQNQIIAVKGVSENYHNKMKGINITEVNFNNFTKTYGGPHCSTQVIYRESSK
ncbi:MAG: arginine deiminase family protein [archaeon]